MKITSLNECYYCKHKREIKGHAHVSCARPDYSMVGDDHGIKSGWFNYPINYDPIWKNKKCNNFKKTSE